MNVCINRIRMCMSEGGNHVMHYVIVIKIYEYAFCSIPLPCVLDCAQIYVDNDSMTKLQ